MKVALFFVGVVLMCVINGQKRTSVIGGDGNPCSGSDVENRVCRRLTGENDQFQCGNYTVVLSQEPPYVADTPGTQRIVCANNGCWNLLELTLPPEGDPCDVHVVTPPLPPPLP